MLKLLAIALLATTSLLGCASSGSSVSTSTPEATAVERPDAPRIIGTSEFIEFLNKLEADLDIGEPRELTDLERRRVDRLASELRNMLDGVSSVESLNSNEQTRVYNKTQELWTAVVGRDEDQVICRRVHRIGTHFKDTKCRTVAEMRSDQRRTAQYLRTWGGNEMILEPGTVR